MNMNLNCLKYLFLPLASIPFLVQANADVSSNTEANSGQEHVTGSESNKTCVGIPPSTRISGQAQIADNDPSRCPPYM